MGYGRAKVLEEGVYTHGISWIDFGDPELSFVQNVRYAELFSSCQDACAAEAAGVDAKPFVSLGLKMHGLFELIFYLGIAAAVLVGAGEGGGLGNGRD